jgi:tetratricopeptide (TPR) repeat protein
MSLEGSGVSRHAGPGAGPIALFVLAGVLGAIAVYVWIKKGDSHRVAHVADAGQDAEPIAVAVIDAGTPANDPPSDAELVVVTPDASTVTDAGIDEPAGSIDAPLDRSKQAKKLAELAAALLSEGKFDEALEQIDGALKLRNTARGHLLRAQILQKLERVDDALTAVDMAVELSATYAPAFDLRGRILWAANRRDEARFAFEQFLAIEPESARAEAIRDLLREQP